MRKRQIGQMTPDQRLMTTAALAVGVILALGVGCGGKGETPHAAASGSGPISGGMPVPGGGLSVREAIASDLEGPLMVRGTLLERGDELRLCDTIDASPLPHCAAYPNSLQVDGASLDELARTASVRRQDDVRWTKQRVSVLGEVDGGSIHVSKLAKG